MNTKNYYQFSGATFLKQWYQKKTASFKRSMILMQDSAPAHAPKDATDWLASKESKGGKMVTWPPCTPDLNPFENLWALLNRESDSQEKLDTSLNSLWAFFLMHQLKWV